MYAALTSVVQGVDRATAGASADEVANETAEQPLILQPRRLRIQIVEDDALIGLLLGDMLEVMGYEVCAIEATEIAAVSAAARCEPDLLIVDANLREGSGVFGGRQNPRQAVSCHTYSSPVTCAASSIADRVRS